MLCPFSSAPDPLDTTSLCVQVGLCFYVIFPHHHMLLNLILKNVDFMLSVWEWIIEILLTFRTSKC